MQLLKVNCSDIFKRIPTDSGMCCALNQEEALRASDYTELVREMQGDNTKDVVEVKSKAGKMKGLRLLLDLHSNDVSFGSLEHDYNAFSIFIGQRAEFPILKEKSIQLQPGQDTSNSLFVPIFNPGLEHFIDLSATMVFAKDIKHLDPEQRNCYFPDEGALTFYEDYTHTNCELECAILEVQKRLGCIPWFLPKVWSYFCLSGIIFFLFLC